MCNAPILKMFDKFPQSAMQFQHFTNFQNTHDCMLFCGFEQMAQQNAPPLPSLIHTSGFATVSLHPQTIVEVARQGEKDCFTKYSFCMICEVRSVIHVYRCAVVVPGHIYLE